MDILILLTFLTVILIIFTYKMITGLKVYNQSIRLQAERDYYQARLERFIK